MLQSKKTNVHNLKQTNIDENIAISPLAIPILAGPGTFVTAMNFVSKATYTHMAFGVVVFTLICLLTYITFRASDFIAEKIGHNEISVVGKIMGPIIAIIGTSMVIEGLKLSF